MLYIKRKAGGFFIMITVIVEKIKKNSTVLKNTAWNLSGQILPLLAALICIPILITEIGTEKFGFLAIAWMIIGYFSLFDFGLGRAITYIVSKMNAENQDATEIINSAVSLLLIISSIVCLLFYIWSDYIVYEILNLSKENQQESIEALKVLSFGLPFVILCIGLRGVLEGCQEFKKISLISIPVGTLFFVAPMLTSLFVSNSLVLIFMSLVIVRFFQFLLFLFYTNKVFPLGIPKAIDMNKMKELVKFGGWMTVTNIVSPIMVNMDRFFIGAKMAVSSVTYYVVPFDMITKMLIIPASLSGVLFPEFSKKISMGEVREAKVLLMNSIVLVALILLPILLFVFVFSYSILELWISKDFADSSYDVLKVLCVGVFFNGVSALPYAFIQGAGRSDITAKFHILELILYLPVLIVFIDFFGLVGVAIAWVLRVILDFILLISYSFKYV